MADFRERDESYTETQARRLENMAARKRWSIPDTLKDKVIKGIEEALDGKHVGRKLKAGRLLKDLEAQNQADEFNQVKQGNGRTEAEIDAEIAANMAELVDGGQAAPAPEAAEPPAQAPDDADDSAAGLS